MADLPDPTSLSDEELDALLETGAMPELKPEPKPKPDEPKPKGEETPEEEPEPKPEPKKEELPKPDPEEEPEEEEKPPSPREQRRVQQLLAKFREQPKQEQPEVPKNALNYKESLDADEETVKKLDSDRATYGNEMYQQGLKQAQSMQFLTRLEIDAAKVDAKYPQLDRDSAEFKPEAASDISLLYLSLAGYDPKTRFVQNPDFRYSDFVDTIFTLANDIGSKEADVRVTNIKKQAAKTGLRPDGTGTKKMDLSKLPSEMDDDELDAMIGLAIPNRR